MNRCGAGCVGQVHGVGDDHVGGDVAHGDGILIWIIAAIPDLRSGADDLRDTVPRRHRAAPRSALAHRLLPVLLARLGLPPASVEHDAQGRPRLPHDGLEVSISHTHGAVGAALCQARGVGIDLEPAMRQPLPASRWWLAPGERDGPCEHRLRLWTAKEAVLKARAGTTRRTVVIEPTRDAGFRARRVSPGSDHHGVLAHGWWVSAPDGIRAAIAVAVGS